MGERFQNTKAELRYQAQWKEMDKKYQLTRMKWFEKNYEKVYLNPSLPKDKVPKKAAILYDEICKMRKERLKEEKGMKGEKKMETPLTLDEYFDRGPMYPVPFKVKDTLYHGISHNDEGRLKYLRLRQELSPEDKYYEPLLWSFGYGWKLGERAYPTIRGHGRVAIIKDNFTRKSGALKIDNPLRRIPFGPKCEVETL
uniref:Sperm microtubule inner protein 1 C-terminal domain-containing protein n=2 Tax=Clastoptera arizonana TaxID=38151 RepID=A0A1B6BZI2_9HEMI